MNAEIVGMLDDLENITKKMEIPSFRRRSVKWLERHLYFRNVSHPRYEEAKALIKLLLKKGAR